MIGSVSVGQPSLAATVNRPKSSDQPQNALPTFGSVKVEDLKEVPVSQFNKVKSDPETMARVQEVLTLEAWTHSPEGMAWREEQLAKQSAQPVELAVYQGDKLVAYKTSGFQPVELAVYQGDKLVAYKTSGFTSTNALHSILPDGWGEMSPNELKQALVTEFRNRGMGNISIRTSTEGLNMTGGEASDIFNRR
ncbi:MAG: hypothetical protein P8X66_02525 [Maritimibacter sp.]